MVKCLGQEIQTNERNREVPGGPHIMSAVGTVHFLLFVLFCGSV